MNKFFPCKEIFISVLVDLVGGGRSDGVYVDVVLARFEHGLSIEPIEDLVSKWESEMGDSLEIRDGVTLDGSKIDKDAETVLARLCDEFEISLDEH